jgi:hypothetical protein
MAITIDGAGTITGVVAGGLPDASVTNDDLATGIASSKLTGALPAISGASLTSLTSGNLTGTIADARFPAALPAISGASLTNLPAAGIRATASAFTNGGYSSNASADLTSVSINLTGLTGSHLIVHGKTAVAENSNTANAANLHIKVHNGSVQTHITQTRNGIPHGQPGNNATWDISTHGIFEITSTYATSCTIYLTGQIDSGAFWYGDQTAYTLFDSQTPSAGVQLIAYVV